MQHFGGETCTKETSLNNCEDNVRLDLRVVGPEAVDGISLAQNRYK
jgi:hypothetical protein